MIGEVGADADMSSAAVVVVVEVGSVAPVLGVPCVVIVVDVVGTLGEVGVMTVVLDTDDAPEPLVAEEPVVADDPVVAGAEGVVLSANETPARVLTASMVALANKNLWDRIRGLLEGGVASRAPRLDPSRRCAAVAQVCRGASTRARAERSRACLRMR
jgi:hypothetical protein